MHAARTVYEVANMLNRSLKQRTNWKVEWETKCFSNYYSAWGGLGWILDLNADFVLYLQSYLGDSVDDWYSHSVCGARNSKLK